MVVSRRAFLPLFFSAIMGVCVLGAGGYVLNGLLRQHAAGSQIAFASVFALFVFALWLRGYWRSWYFLSQYAREERALPETKSKLEEMAGNAAQGSWQPSSFQSIAPLLDRRFTQTWRALQRGAPLLSGDMAESEDRYFPGPEREIRTYMDIALNVGIAGTFVSILVTLGQPQGLTADTLLAHVGPGMTSGLAAVVANIGLRICHRALQDEQDLLAGQVDEAVSTSFVDRLPRAITSPEERLVTATRKTLDEQSVLFNAQLKQYMGQLGNLLAQQIQQPVQKVADTIGVLAAHTGALARHSGSWAETAADLKTAHTGFLQAQSDAQAEHEKRLTALFGEFAVTLASLATAAKKANSDAVQETQAFTRQLLEGHTVALTAMTEHLQTQFIALQTEQEATHQRLTARSLAALTGAVDGRLAAMDSNIGGVLASLESRLPETLRVGVQDALSETVALINSVREQTAELAHLIGQISGNADRQLLAYERWNERAMSVQGRLEQVVMDGQAAQSSLLARWQTDAGQTLDGVRSAFDGAAHAARSGFLGLSESFQSLQGAVGDLQGALATLPAQLTETRAKLADPAGVRKDSDNGHIPSTYAALPPPEAVQLEQDA